MERPSPLTSPAPPAWSRSEEKQIRKWNENCKLYRQLHRCAIRYYTHRENLLSVPILVLSAVTGTTGFATLSAQSQGVSIAMGATGFLLTVLGAVRQHFKFHTHTATHMSTEISYARLITKIEGELCRPPERRTSPDVFLEDVAAEYERLLAAAQDIPVYCLNRFKRRQSSVRPPIALEGAESAEKKEEEEKFTIDIV